MLEHWMPLRLVAAAEARELLGCGQKGLAWQAEVQRKGVASYERRVTRTHRGAMETTNEAARRVRDGRTQSPGVCGSTATTKPHEQISDTCTRFPQTSTTFLEGHRLGLTE
jgi:hypothetical protein